MYIEIYNRESNKRKSKDIDKEKELFLFTDFYKDFGEIPKELRYEPRGESKYCSTGYIVEAGLMSMDFEIEDLCSISRGILHEPLNTIAKFLEVEQSFIDSLSFVFE